MKKGLLPVAGGLLLCAAAVPMLGKSEPQGLAPGLQRLRGTPEWFEGPTATISVPAVEAPLLGKNAPRLLLALSFECRGGLDAVNPPRVDAAAQQRVRDALMAAFGALTPEQAGESVPERFALKRLVLPVIEHAAFPAQEARVTRVHFEKLLFAGGS